MRYFISALKIVSKLLMTIVIMFGIRIICSMLFGGTAEDINLSVRYVLVLTAATICTILPIMAWEIYHEL